MSFPASLITRKVWGGFVTHPDGKPARGTVRIVLDQYMQGPSDNLFVAPFDVTFKLVDGWFETYLPATNDPEWSPGIYKVVLNINNTKPHRDKFVVPYDSTDPIELASVLNLPDPIPGHAYILAASRGVAGGVASLDNTGRVPVSQMPAGVGGSIFWDDVEDKPSTFPPSTHVHAYADVTDKPSTFPPSTHNHTLSDVTGLVTSLDSKADLVGGVIPTGQIPSISVVDFLGNKASEAEMLASSGQKGDWCIRTDLGQAWVITDTDSSILASWTPMPLAAVPVQTVNGQTGTVVLGKSDVGLGNVDNTSDVNKPVSTAQQDALDDKADVTHTHSTSDITSLDTALASKAAVSHGHPTSDITGLDTALSGKAATSHAHATSDITGLDTALSGKAATSHAHSTSDITSGTLPTDRGGTGLSSFTANNFLRAASTTALEFRSAAQVLSDIGAAASSHSHAQSDITGLVSALAAKADDAAVTSALALKAPLASPTFTGTVTGITKTMVGLGNVDNTSDSAKPISAATALALSGFVAPSDHGYSGWTFPPECVQGGTILPTAGLSYVVRIRLTKTTVSAINFHFTVGGNTLANCYVSLHNDAGAVIGTEAITADQSTAWQSGGYKSAALVTPQAVTPGWHKIRWWIGSATTMPTLSRGINSNTAITNAGLSSPNFRFATADSGMGVPSVPPSNIGTLTGAATAWWVSVTE